ncbi:hypothetical protein [Qipengyuania seohaensis]|uniref:hypothetical protein n=1 Tax=Qipengyuania seohaensis TaxID=266951 RepID=UPI000C22A240|nr:hypothetical protein [Qipengyuania seohaensis]
MQQTTDAAPYITAISLALYAVHDQLVAQGSLQPGSVPKALRAFDPGANEEAKTVAAIMEAIATNLESFSFGPGGSPRQFDIVDGGKGDE